MALHLTAQTLLWTRLNAAAVSRVPVGLHKLEQDRQPYARVVLSYSSQQAVNCPAVHYTCT